MNLDEAKAIVTDVIQLNQTMIKTQQELQKYSRKYKSTAIYNDDISRLFYFIDKATNDKKIAVTIKNEIISNDINIACSYFKAVVDHNINAGAELAKAIELITNDFDKLYDLLLNYIGNKCWYSVYRNNYRWYRKEQVVYKEISLQDTSVKCIIPYLGDIFKRFGDKIFKKCRRGYKRMFAFYFLFQEYFTDEMYEVLIARMKTYNDETMTNYILKCSRRLPTKYKDKLAAVSLLLDIKND